jgi:hypothetical protein
MHSTSAAAAGLMHVKHAEHANCSAPELRMRVGSVQIGGSLSGHDMKNSESESEELRSAQHRPKEASDKTEINQRASALLTRAPDPSCRPSRPPLDWRLSRSALARIPRARWLVYIRSVLTTEPRQSFMSCHCPWPMPAAHTHHLPMTPGFCRELQGRIAPCILDIGVCVGLDEGQTVIVSPLSVSTRKVWTRAGCSLGRLL